MFKKGLIFGAGALLGVYATVNTLAMWSLLERNCKQKEELEELKASTTETEQ